ncbi:MAG: class I SAM-dependent methyltransferase [Pseudoxanthomonas sp.]
MHDTDARRSAWSQYWSAGGLHSCPGSFAGNYAGAIAEFWRTTLADLAPGARVLDLATGNGALPQMLFQRYGDAVSVDAVDAAQLAPGWFSPSEHPHIRFHSAVMIEALPFADAGFDYVFSQYGFEYAVRPDAFREALRVLRPHGQMALVMHHSDSVLANVARIEQGHFAWLLGSEGLLTAADGLSPWLSKAKLGENLRGNTLAEESRRLFNEAQRELAERAAASPVPDLLLEARDQVQRFLQLPQPQSLLRRYTEALQAAQLRSAELLQFALSPAELDSWAAWLGVQRPDRRVQVEVLRQAEGIMGWGLRLGPG